MAWKEVLVKRRPRLVRHSVAASLLVFASLTPFPVTNIRELSGA